MSSAPDPTDAGWTMGTYIIHNEALRSADEKFQAERDRRYKEVADEKEKALKIKETADLAALTLARESQQYKDEKSDKTREQSLAERGDFITRSDLTSVVDKIETSLKPVFDFVSSQQGVTKGAEMTTAKLLGLVAASGTIMGLLFALINAITK